MCSSYAHAYAARVRTLAENLTQPGLNLAFDEWDIGPGDVLIHKLDEMLLATRDGILVVSSAAMRSTYVQAEYAALPPLLTGRLWVDFRDSDGEDRCRLPR